MVWYVWFYSMTYLNGPVETGYFRSNSDELSTAAQQLYDYLGDGYNIQGLQFDGKIIDVANKNIPHQLPHQVDGDGTCWAKLT